MLRKRLIASVFFLVPMLTVFWLDSNKNFGQHGTWAVPVIAVFSILIVGELLQMTRERTAGAIPWICYAGVILCHLSTCLPILKPDSPLGMWGAGALALCVVLIAAFVHELRTYEPDRKPTERIGLTLFIVFYAGWLLSFLSAMRFTLPNGKGSVALFSVLFIIKLSDSGAYFTGKNLGKHRLAPVLSPGKTVEGLVGGIVTGILGAIIVFLFIMPQVVDNYVCNWLAVLGYGLTIVITGVVGDLAESLIKREMQCKDSSGWLPGLGGIMDTADSVILSAPIAYVWWLSGWL